MKNSSITLSTITLAFTNKIENTYTVRPIRWTYLLLIILNLAIPQHELKADTFRALNNMELMPNTHWVTAALENQPGSLRGAVDNAQSGDTIRFSSDLNFLAIRLDRPIFIGKDLVFVGNGSGITFIDGRDYSWYIFVVNYGANVVFKDITIQNGGAGNGGAISVSGTVKFISCVFHRNATASPIGGGAIYMFSSGRCTTISCTFDNNSTEDNRANGGAVYIDRAFYESYNCLYFDNRAGRFGAVVANIGGTAIIANATVVSNNSASKNSVFYHQDSAKMVLNNNIIYDNNGLPALTNSNSPIIQASNNLTDIAGDLPVGSSGNSIGNPAFVANNNFQLQDTSPAVNAGSGLYLPVDLCDVDGDGNMTELIPSDITGSIRVNGCQVDLGAYESSFSDGTNITTTKYVTNVDDSGPGSLRATIDCSQSGDTIRFHPSTNGDSIKLNSTLSISKDLVLIGNGLTNTIVDGSNFDARLLRLHQGTTSAFLGITFQHGGDKNYIGKGAAFSIDGKVKFLSCLFRQNVTESAEGGGALHVRNVASCQSINCQFEENAANHFTADGGAVIVDGKYQSINCLYVRNHVGRYGAAVANHGGAVQITNCTATENSSDITNSVFYHQDQATTTLNNNIIHANNGLQAITQIGLPTLHAQNNLIDISGDIPVGVQGNFVGDPAFVDATNDNYQLQSTSAAIDAGLDALLPNDSCDVDGDGNISEPISFDFTNSMRVRGCFVDLGALESDYSNVLIPKLVTNVNDSGPGSFRRIVSCAVAGDTIRFHPAINGDTIKLNSSITVTKDLVVIGNGETHTIIDGSNYTDGRLIDLLGGTSTTFRAMTFQHGGDSTRGGAFLVQGQVKLIACDFHQNRSNHPAGGGALYIDSMGNCTAINCQFEQNQSTKLDANGGAVLVNGGQFQSVNCLYANNHTENYGAVVANHDGAITITNCTATKNTSAISNSVFFHSDSALTILRNNIIHDNNGLKALTTTGFPTLQAKYNLVDVAGDLPTGENGNRVGDPAFVDAVNGNYQLQSHSMAIAAGMFSLLPLDSCDVDADGNTTELLDVDLVDSIRVQGCQVDLGAYESTFSGTANTSRIVTNTQDVGPGSLRAIISCAQAGDTIRFDPSIDGDSIKLSSDIHINKNLVITGNGTANTIIAGGNVPDRLFRIEEEGSATFKGIVFSNAGGNNISGGAIRILGDGKFIDCVFANNQSRDSFGGGAIYVNGTCATINCIFDSNITDNSGLADGGAVMVVRGEYHAITCLYTNNHAEYIGAAVGNDRGSIRITNCTATNNTSIENFGVFANNSGRSILHNNIIYSNGGQPALRVRGDTAVDAQFNLVDVPGLIPLGVSGNITGNPDFVNPANNDYQLQTTSIAIGAGQMLLLPIDSCDVDHDGNTTEQIDIDLAGNARIQACQVDLGAYESPHSSSRSTRFVTNTNDSGPGSLRGIIDCAHPGDTIRFHAATNGDSIKLLSTILMDKDLVIIGNGRSSTIVDGASYSGDLIRLPAGTSLMAMGITYHAGGGIGCFSAISIWGEAKFLNCDFRNNTSINGCGGAALSIRSPGTGTAIGCIFDNNTSILGSKGGAVSVYRSTYNTINSLYTSNNSDGLGSVITSENGTVTLTNCTMTGNTSDNNNSVLYHEGLSTTTLHNNIIYGNNGMAAISHIGLTSLDAHYNLVDFAGDIEVGTNGNTIGDPEFVDANNNNYQLLQSSIAIDAGQMMLLPIDSCDVDGDGNITERIDIDLGSNNRISRCQVDLGAYELGDLDFCPAVNDLCAGAIELSCDSSLLGNFDLATTSGRPAAHEQCVSTVKGLWYRLSGTGDSLQIAVEGGSRNIQVFTGDCTSLQCVVGVEGNQLGFVSQSDQEYLIYIDGDSGAFTVSLECFSKCPPTLHVNGMPLTGNYFAGVALHSDAIIKSPRMIEFQAGTEINLQPNFEVELGATLLIKLDDCPASN